MDEMADIWIFYARGDSEFGEAIADRIRNDIKDKTVRTSSDLANTISHPTPIRPNNVVLIVLPERDVGGSWFVHEQVTALLSATTKLMTIQYKPNIKVPACFSRYENHDFTGSANFESDYKRLQRNIKWLLMSDVER